MAHGIGKQVIQIGGGGGGLTNPMTTLGDIIIGETTGTPARLGGNTSTSPKFLTSIGDGTNATEPYWDIIPASGNIEYYLSDVSSDIGGYYVQDVIPVSNNSFTASGLTTGTTLIGKLLTPAGTPGLNFIPGGQYDLELIVQKTVGTKLMTVYGELWETNSLGVDIAKIGTFTSSLGITVKSNYRLDFVTTAPYTLASTTSRISTKVYANGGASGSSATLVFYFGNGDNSRTSLPHTVVTTNTIVPYEGAITDVNLGVHNITAGNLSGTNTGDNNFLIGTTVIDFGTENDRAVTTVSSTLITNANIKSFSVIPQETTETSLDDFTNNNVAFNIENIVDNVSFDITGSAGGNATGNYTFKYLLTY